MTATLFTGPLVSSGVNQAGTLPESNPNAGPSIFYQGEAILDPRDTPINKDNLNYASVQSFFHTAPIAIINKVPTTYSTSIIAALQNATSGTALTLATASTTGIACAIPVQPADNSAVFTAAVMPDFGFDYLSVTAASNVATPAGTMERYTIGMSLVIAGAGNSAGTLPLLTYITAVGASTITLADNAQATNATAPVGLGNAYPDMQGAHRPTAYSPYIMAGIAGLFDPAQSMARGVQIYGSTSATGGTFTISGYDLYGKAQTEAVTHVGGATAAYSKKTYSAITSVTPGFTDAHNYSVGTSDLFGLAFRTTYWESLDASFAGSKVTASTGFVAADTTSPATTTTGDVRGTLQLSSIGPSASYVGSNASNGTRRLTIYQRLAQIDVAHSSPSNLVPLFGVVPV